MAVAALCASCSDWLDVQPSDRISEENNFSDVAGFKKALNGVYVELNRSSLYGRNLTCGFIEVLSQRYAVGDDNKSVKEYMGFNYSGSAAESILSDIWSTAYTLIANVNAILKNCELHRDVLSDEYYHLIRGEALALRAFLHFDLFRLFGPVYATNAADASIPYYTEFSLNVAPSYVGEEFMAMVTADLIDAEKELEDDPIIRRGVEGNTMDTFLRYRNLRLNYYAVQALLARAYYYMGDSENALSYAKKVIAVQEEKFPWINPMKLTNTASMDRVFSTEVLFAAQNLQRNDLFTSLFDGSNLKLSTLLAPREDVTNYLFDYDKVDYRYMSSLKNAIEISGSSYSIFNKYQGTDSLYNQMIPLIRVSEAYLIATETAADRTEKLGYLNTLRNHRGVKNVSSPSSYYIKREWLREFYGEGQLFFWYKRNQESYIQSAYDPYGTVSISSSSYKMPIPDGELKYN